MPTSNIVKIAASQARFHQLTLHLGLLNFQYSDMILVLHRCLPFIFKRRYLLLNYSWRLISIWALKHGDIKQKDSYHKSFFCTKRNSVAHFILLGVSKMMKLSPQILMILIKSRENTGLCPFSISCPKLARHTLKILQQMLKDFSSVSDLFGTVCIKRLKLTNFYRENLERYKEPISSGQFLYLNISEVPNQRHNPSPKKSICLT